MDIGASPDSTYIQSNYYLRLTPFQDLFCTKPPPPELTYANFTPDAAGVLIEFDMPTDEAGFSGYFDCDEVIVDADQTIDYGCKCLFLNPWELLVEVTSNVTSRIGTVVTLKDSVLGLLSILNLCPFGSSEYASGSVVIQWPEAPLTPVVRISGSQRVQYCDGLTLSASIQSARILQYHWSLTPQGDDPLIVSILDAATFDITIPPEVSVVC